MVTFFFLYLESFSILKMFCFWKLMIMFFPCLFHMLGKQIGKGNSKKDP